MAWKDWSYWLRGGIIGLLLASSIIIVMFFILNLGGVEYSYYILAFFAVTFSIAFSIYGKFTNFKINHM